ncbi:hypothetical protein IEO21_04135 [Rhodonia placenta]|uniref:Histone deacetylase domain-containing protein n=1 Tax=Rhodonia placenta TaxID=104341 RepID=A0A8H7U3L0_9APHY|nr:hypothetical protein IEO21_04135 [Postia placenta]
MIATNLEHSLTAQKTAVYLQKACLQHQYIRSRDTSCIVERPERLRAVNIGLAAAVSRLEECTPVSNARSAAQQTGEPASADDLAAAIGQLNIASSSRPKDPQHPIEFVHSSAKVDLLHNAAVKFIHGDIEGDVYLENLKRWSQESHEKVSKGESEIPATLAQGDLYLCPESIDAIQGALGTVCEAVDAVVASTRRAAAPDPDKANTPRAFVAVRPPGHHCGEDTPSGFCFVNNVGVAAAHELNKLLAHLQHGINRVVVFDIDLHHGNGTQSIAWQINEETYRKTIEEMHGAPAGKPGLRMFYGSIHDVLSYPCEDGKPELVQAASVSIHGPHGQHIENIHLQPYESEQQFWDELYDGLYVKLRERASAFLEGTGGAGDDVLVFISCGFDASEHEYPSMSRHGRHVPTSFYKRFAQDTIKFAERFSGGRLISVLEGGYSDRALTSGAMAHLIGLVDPVGVDESWWSLNNLTELEKATKKRRGGRVSQPSAPAPWIGRTLEVFASIDSSHTVAPTTSSRASVPLSSRTLRERKNPPVKSADSDPEVSPHKSGTDKRTNFAKDRKKNGPGKASSPESTTLVESSDGSSFSSLSDIPEEGVQPKKLPRVILRLGSAPKA